MSASSANPSTAAAAAATAASSSAASSSARPTLAARKGQKTKNSCDRDAWPTTKRPRKEKTKPKIPAPIKSFVIATGHIFKWPSQHKELKEFLAANGYFVAIPDDGLPLVPNADELVLDALAHMGVDLRSIPLAEAAAYWISNRPSSIANGIVAGEVNTSVTAAGYYKQRPTHVGHCEFAWKVRTHPMPIGIAQYIVGAPTDEHQATLPVVTMNVSSWCTVKEIIRLIVDYAQGPHFLRVGFDSINVGGTGKDPWWHVDVGFRPYALPYRQLPHPVVSQFTDLQMLYNARECNERTGGLMVKPTSHLHHIDVVRRNEMPSRHGKNPDFIRMQVDPETGEYTEPNVNTLPTTLVVAPAHAITGWLSQTIHCNARGNAPPLKAHTPITSLSQLFPRLISYVSYYPWWTCGAFDMLRIDQFWNGITTNHSAMTMIPKRAMFREKKFEHAFQPYAIPIMSPNDYSLIASAEVWGQFGPIRNDMAKALMFSLMLNIYVAVDLEKKTKKIKYADAKGRRFYQDEPLTAEELLWLLYSPSSHATDCVRKHIETNKNQQFVDDEGAERIPIKTTSQTASSASSSSSAATAKIVQH